MNLKRTGRKFGFVAAVAMLAMVLQGCGSDGDGSGISQDMYDALQADYDQAVTRQGCRRGRPNDGRRSRLDGSRHGRQDGRPKPPRWHAKAAQSDGRKADRRGPPSEDKAAADLPPRWLAEAAATEAAKEAAMADADGRPG